MADEQEVAGVRGRPNAPSDDNTVRQQAVYECLAYLLDHEDEMASGWAEADAFLDQLGKKGWTLVSRMQQSNRSVTDGN